MDCYTAKLMNLASNFLRKPLQNVLCCSAAKSCTALCNPWTPASQAPLSSTNSWSLLKFMSIESMMPSNHLILCPPSPLDFNLSQHQGLFQWVSCSHQVARVLELQLQHQSFQWISRIDFPSDWLVWSPWCPRDSQESSPAPQFEGINSLVLSLLYGPTLTSICNSWKKHTSDYTDLCWQSEVSACQYAV